MYNDGNATSNTLNTPIPKGSIIPETMATAFCPIEKTPHISPRAQVTQVSHTQALDSLQGSQGTSGSIIRKPTPVKIIEQPTDNSKSSAEHTQNQPVTLVSTTIVPCSAFTDSSANPSNS